MYVLICYLLWTDNALRELRGVSNGLIPSEYADQLFEMCEVVRVATQLEMLDLVADASGSLVRVLRTVTSDGEEVQQHVVSCSRICGVKYINGHIDTQ